MKAIEHREHWYELPKKCCGTCKHSSTFGGERPPCGWGMCDHPEHPSHTVRLIPDTNCKDYERGFVLQ